MRFFIFYLCLFLLSGCMQMQMLPYLDQALTLKAFGQEKDAQHKYVTNVDAKFDRMLAAIQSGDIKKCKTEKDIIESFGPPVLAWEDQLEVKPVKRALYRCAIQSKGPHKVYVYYDPQGIIIKIE